MPAQVVVPGSPFAPVSPLMPVKAKANDGFSVVPLLETTTFGVPTVASTDAVAAMTGVTPSAPSVPFVPSCPFSPCAPFKFLKEKANERANSVPPCVTVTDGTPTPLSTVAVAPVIVAFFSV